ncbi:MAG: TetR family transcriptional regulator [Candidatus Korobacteraceae bacterium]
MKPRPSTSRFRGRVELTRSRLIQAAEKIFARDGFEAARLEEIAVEAGYTRGAFYANFKSKEDLFLALLEREISSRIDAVETRINQFREPEGRLRAFREFFLTVSQDRRWSLLALEFKLFAVRHPEVKTRLAALNRRLVGSRVGIFQEIMEESGRKLPASASAVARSLSAVANALTLEHMLDRTVISEEALQKILANYFDSLTGIPDTRAVKAAQGAGSLRKRRVAS